MAIEYGNTRPSADRPKALLTLDDALLSNKTASEVTRPATEIEKAYARITDNNLRMAEVIDQLERRLMPVLGPQPPSDRVNNNNDPGPSRSSLATGLHGLADGQETMTDRLGNIINRLEL